MIRQARAALQGHVRRRACAPPPQGFRTLDHSPLTVTPWGVWAGRGPWSSAQPCWLAAE